MTTAPRMLAHQRLYSASAHGMSLVLLTSGSQVSPHVDRIHACGCLNPRLPVDRMKHIEYVCCNCDKIFTPETAHKCLDRNLVLCPVCGSAEWEELPEVVADFLEDIYHAPL